MKFCLGENEIHYLEKGYYDSENPFFTTGDVAIEVEEHNREKNGIGAMEYFAFNILANELADMIGQSYLDLVVDGVTSQEGVTFNEKMQERFVKAVNDKEFKGIKQGNLSTNKMAKENETRFSMPMGEYSHYKYRYNIIPFQRTENIPLKDSGLYRDNFRAWLQP